MTQFRPMTPAEANGGRIKPDIEAALTHLEYAAFNLCSVSEIDIKSIVDSTCPEKSLLIGIRDLKQALSDIDKEEQ